jgi:hypothetical protein
LFELFRCSHDEVQQRCQTWKGFPIGWLDRSGAPELALGAI